MYQPEQRTKSWKDSIRVQRHRIPRHIGKNPSLKVSDLAIFADAYENARMDASVETDLDSATFPPEPPFTPAEALDPDYWPGDPGV